VSCCTMSCDTRHALERDRTFMLTDVAVVTTVDVDVDVVVVVAAAAAVVVVAAAAVVLVVVVVVVVVVAAAPVVVVGVVFALLCLVWLVVL